MFCTSLFVLLYFFFRPLYCLFFDLRLLITPLVSSNFSCYSIFSFICMFCRSLFVLLYFSFIPLCCLFFYYLRLLITPLVSFSHCVVCSLIYSFWLPLCVVCSLIYGFWLPLWYLQTFLTLKSFLIFDNYISCMYIYC